MKQITVEISNYLADALQRYADSTKQTTSRLVGQALEGMLGIKHVPVSRAKKK